MTGGLACLVIIEEKIIQEISLELISEMNKIFVICNISIGGKDIIREEPEICPEWEMIQRA